MNKTFRRARIPFSNTVSDRKSRSHRNNLGTHVIAVYGTKDPTGDRGWRKQNYNGQSASAQDHHRVLTMPEKPANASRPSAKPSTAWMYSKIFAM